MKKNLILAGYNYARLRRLATQFAEIFDMRFFDIYDYFIFDNSPNSIADLYHQNGWEYVDEQVKDLESHGAVVSAPSGAIRRISPFPWNTDQSRPVLHPTICTSVKVSLGYMAWPQQGII